MNQFPISATDILELEEICSRKDWKGEACASQLRRLIKRLSTEERRLFFHLTENFLQIRLAEYEPKILALARKLRRQIKLRKPHQVLLVPPITESTSGSRSVKSGHLVVYLLQIDLRDFCRRNSIKFQQRDLIEHGCQYGPNTLVVIADDFVGSGLSVLKFLEKLGSQHGVNSSNTVVATIVALEIGIQALEKVSSEVVYTVKLSKGISEDPKIADKPNAIKLMTDIESRMKVGPDYNLGFGKSEALVSMIRCPNNTFPVYWWTKNDWPAPFTR